MNQIRVLFDQNLVLQKETFKKYSKKKYNSFCNNNFWYKEFKNKKNPFNQILKDTYKILTKNNFKCNPNIFLIEFHSYNLNNIIFDNKMIMVVYQKKLIH